MIEVSWKDWSSIFLDLLKRMLWPDLLSETVKLDLLSRGDRVRSELFLRFELRIGDRLVLMRDELFYERFLASFWDLKKMRAGVVVFFLEEEKG